MCKEIRVGDATPAKRYSFAPIALAAILFGFAGVYVGAILNADFSRGLEADTDEICADGGLYTLRKHEAFFLSDHQRGETYYVGRTHPVVVNHRLKECGPMPLDKMIRLQAGHVLLEQPYDFNQERIDLLRRDREQLQELLHKRRSECPQPELPSTFVPPTSNDKSAWRVLEDRHQLVSSHIVSRES